MLDSLFYKALKYSLLLYFSVPQKDRQIKEEKPEKPKHKGTNTNMKYHFANVSYI